MSFVHLPDKELFEEGVLLETEYNKDLRCDLQGLYRLSDGEHFVPCLYKKVLSYKNGFARVIDLAGNLRYVGQNGDYIFDRELPFVPELCDDFDENGKAYIACLIDGTFIVSGYMNTDGEFFLKNYNEA